MMNFEGNRAPQVPMLERWANAVALAVAAILILAVPALHAQAHSSAKAAAASEAGAGGSEVARGKYLVENVAMCGQCHTPRDSNGALDRSRWLQGTSVPFQPSQPQTNWPLLAPRIGGTMPATDPDMIKLLTTGIWTNGAALRFPMMPFRMNEADAKAIVAYLKTAGPKN